jgi:hypothetical protein
MQLHLSPTADTTITRKWLTAKGGRSMSRAATPPPTGAAPVTATPATFSAR